MKRIMLTVAYDGTNYSGWQIQPMVPTVEGVLNQVISDFLKEDIQVIGASRTDAGVHAKGAIAVFDTNSSIPGDKYSYAINNLLPRDIRIINSKQVAEDFHPRKVNCRKTYEYCIYNDTFELPTKRLYSYWVYGDIDVDSMNRAARILVGEHDFTSFCSAETIVESKVRTIYDLKVTHNDKDIVVTVTGNGFLYNMVRIIAGTLLEVGRGKLAVEEIEDILLAKDRTRAGMTVPAKGLCLVKYDFEENIE